MARLTASQRNIAITVASVIALIAAIAGALAVSGYNKAQAKESKPAVDAKPTRPVPIEIVHMPESGGKAVNITIDDGPDPTWTPKVLEVLKQNDVKAVFCVVGPQAKAHPDLIKEILAAGHRLCDHSMTHDTGMDKKSEAYQSQEILDAQRMIEQAAGGVKVQYWRAPGGAFTPFNRKLAAAHGMRPLGWNVDSKDFEKPGVGAIVSTVKHEVAGGPTLLFHDGGGKRDQTVAALEKVLPWLKQQGYTFSFPKIY
ncbi:polysaccharide deacetylase family protein [Streptomyces sp. H39-S7]|uniref:polysaccharide deacetylase family protein n=1 Tax=Streptomyces sp. H39-S7 TaxID=3004357 RepID=UPI0022AFDDFA|nr:polysaccharide deacetylase family protein [Streptomyces sp. H39-S7]MCZ4123250.1 polysaccharide deacetylase family protein [Streptomyces sp. H39-S7]